MPLSIYPTWLNSSYFEEILRRNYRNTSIKVHDVKIEPCSKTTDGFLSTLLRVHVRFFMSLKHETASFVLKMSPSNEVAIEKVGTKGYNVQCKEMLFFEVIAPQVEKILKRAGDDDKLIPAAIAIDREHDVIVFEDLKALDFVLADKMIGLNESQALLTLKKLAKFHAVTLLIQQKHPNSFDTFDAGMFSRKITTLNDAFLSIFEVAIEEVATWTDFGKYAVKMKLLRETFIERATRCFDVEDGEFCVLNHGDVWTNNVMFKHGETRDALLIDFQFLSWGSPALDLIHFLYTSLNEELFNQDKIDQLVQQFYYYLKESLGSLSFDLTNFPTLHQFQIQFAAKMFYAFVYTLVVFPIMTSDDIENDFPTHHSRDERATIVKRRMLKSQRYQKIVKRMLPVFDQKGLLDVVD